MVLTGPTRGAEPGTLAPMNECVQQEGDFKSLYDVAQATSAPMQGVFAPLHDATSLQDAFAPLQDATSLQDAFAPLQDAESLQNAFVPLQDAQSMQGASAPLQDAFAPLHDTGSL